MRHLNDILEEFLSVGRITEGKTAANPTNLNSLGHDTMADVQSPLKAGQTIGWWVDCPIPVRLDAALPRKILMNPLSNTFRYPGGNTVITVRAGCRPHELTLTVQDQGMGISKENQTHLFEQFFRAPRVATVPGTRCHAGLLHHHHT